MEYQTCVAGGKRIAYLEGQAESRRTDDSAAVVFVHGNSSSAATWLPALEGEFGRRRRCLAMDLPGHGRSERATNVDDYSLPGYAAVLTAFTKELGVSDAVFVGWSMGGQILLEAAPALSDARGFFVFGTPPVASPAQMADAFLPNADASALFTDSVSTDAAERAARTFTAPGSHLDISEFVAEILATDGAARVGLASSAGAGRFADEVAIVAHLRQPLAIVHGAEEQLVNLDYLRQLDIPTLWRGEVQVVPGTGHAVHREAPQQFADLVTQFVQDLAGS